jgi:hypothetical protein
VCNLAWCSSCAIRRENAPDDCGFIFDNFEFARFAGHRAIPVGTPPGVSTIAHHTGHAAADLLRAILALHLSDEPADPNQD